MEYKIAKENIVGLIKQRNILGVLLGLMFLSNALLAFSALLKDTRTVVVPANLSNEISVSSYGVSNAYLEEMTTFFLSYLLDLTPSNINYRSQVILKYVAPDSYQTLNNYFQEQIKKHKDYNLSTNFVLNEFELNEKDLTAIAKGVLTSHFGKNGKTQEPKKYIIKYRYKAGKLLIESFALLEEEEGKNDRNN